MTGGDRDAAPRRHRMEDLGSVGFVTLCHLESYFPMEEYSVHRSPSTFNPSTWLPIPPSLRITGRCPKHPYGASGCSLRTFRSTRFVHQLSGEADFFGSLDSRLCRIPNDPLPDAADRPSLTFSTQAGTSEGMTLWCMRER